MQLSDFGISLFSESTSITEGPQHPNPSHEYRPPEFHDPESFGLTAYKPTVESDIYALAMLCIEVLADCVLHSFEILMS